jgi:cell division protein FtsQ
MNETERLGLWQNAPMMNRLSFALMLMTTLALATAAVWWAINRPIFTIESVRIEPAPGYQLRHVSSSQLRAASQRGAGSNFFTVNLDDVRGQLETVPWVRRASIRRVWPNHLVIGIEEHQPMAVWGDSGLVNTFGEMFTASITQAEEDGPLPVLRGPEGSEALVVKRFEELRLWLAAIGRRPETVILSSRHAWSVTLDDETKLLLGREQTVSIEERVKRWVTVFPRVQDRLDRKAELIDLRYPNGFAIRAVEVVKAEDAAGIAPDDPVARIARKN